jgi:hypothetical protein
MNRGVNNSVAFSAVALLIVGSIVSCDSSSGGAGGAGGAAVGKWEVSDMNACIASVSNAVLETYPGNSKSSADLYGGCSCEALQSIATAQEVLSNPYSKTKELFKNGELEKCVKESGVTAADWSLEQISAAKQTCSSAALSSYSSMSSSYAMVYCGCMVESAALRWPYNDYARNEVSYTEQMLADGTVPRCLDSASKFTGEKAPVKNGSSILSAPQAVVLYAPGPGSTRTRTFRMAVTGTDIQKYRVKIKRSSYVAFADCAVAMDYTEPREITVAIEHSSSGDYEFVSMCIVGMNSKGIWQSYNEASTYSWTFDQSPPSSPWGLTISVHDGNKAKLEWVQNGTGSGYLVTRRLNTGTTATNSTSFPGIQGAQYDVGEKLGLSDILYVGPNLSFLDNTVSVDTTYVYEVFSYDSVKNYSGSVAKSFTTTQWSSFTRVSAQDQPTSLPKVALDGLGNAIVVWQQTVDGVVRGFYARYEPSGGWSQPAILDEGSGAVDSLQVFLDDAGKGFAIWREGATVCCSSDKKVYTKRYDGGWQGATLLDSKGSKPKGSISSLGHFAVLWHKSDTNQLWANIYIEGTGWSTSRSFGTYNGYTGAEIAINSSGKTLLAWGVTENGTKKIKYKGFNPAAGWTWSTDFYAEFCPSCEFPSVDIDDYDRMALAYRDGASSMKVATGAFVPNLQWGPGTSLAFQTLGGASNLFNKSVRFTSAGDILVAYFDNATGDIDNVRAHLVGGTNKVVSNLVYASTKYAAQDVQLKLNASDDGILAFTDWGAGVSTFKYLKATKKFLYLGAITIWGTYDTYDMAINSAGKAVIVGAGSDGAVNAAWLSN